MARHYLLHIRHDQKENPPPPSLKVLIEMVSKSGSVRLSISCIEYAGGAAGGEIWIGLLSILPIVLNQIPLSRRFLETILTNLSLKLWWKHPISMTKSNTLFKLSLKISQTLKLILCELILLLAISIALEDISIAVTL